MVDETGGTGPSNGCPGTGKPPLTIEPAAGIVPYTGGIIPGPIALMPIAPGSIIGTPSTLTGTLPGGSGVPAIMGAVVGPMSPACPEVDP